MSQPNIEETTTEMSNDLQDVDNEEMPSIIRHDEESFGETRESFESPTDTILQTEETRQFVEQHTIENSLRLQRLRDDLARQVRIKEDERIELEIMQLQNSLDRRHRRHSDHYADLTYDAEHGPEMLSMSNSSTSSSSVPTTEPIVPLLPPIPTIPITEPSKETIGLLDYKRVVTLTSKITPDLADRFYKQSRQADFSLPWPKCILEEALEYIRMRVQTSYTQLNITEEAALEWDPHTLDYKQMAALVYKLFGNTTRTETQVQIFNAINTFNFGWKIDDKEIEEESYANLCKLLTDHYGPIKTIDLQVQESVAKLIYKKLPGHTEMHKLYTDKTKSDTTLNGPDTITRALNRYLSVIQTVRNLTEKARAYRIVNDEFYSGPTLERANKESSTNKVISYGKVAQKTAPSAPVLSKVRDADWGTTQSRCETCGKKSHTRETCKLFGNALANNSNAKWHHSKIGQLWRSMGFHEWTIGKRLGDLGIAQWEGGTPPRDYVYPNDAHANLTAKQKDTQPKHNAWYANRRHEQPNNYDNRDDQFNNYNNRDNRDNHYMGSNDNHNYDNKRPRSE